uniref:Uncharacterized protein n=1 Tax=Rhizophora mucronata TaxID=61149 RepID=A0A2P2QAL8_RHIMU
MFKLVKWICHFKVNVLEILRSNVNLVFAVSLLTSKLLAWLP